MWYVVILACASTAGPAPVLDCPALWTRQPPDFDSAEACEVQRRKWQAQGYEGHCVNTDMPAPTNLRSSPLARDKS